MEMLVVSFCTNCSLNFFHSVKFWPIIPNPYRKSSIVVFKINPIIIVKVLVHNLVQLSFTLLQIRYICFITWLKNIAKTVIIVSLYVGVFKPTSLNTPLQLTIKLISVSTLSLLFHMCSGSLCFQLWNIVFLFQLLFLECKLS